MTTTHELCEVLAAALGVELQLVQDHALALREAGLFPGDDADTDDAQAEPENAALLLVALMTGAPPEKSSNAVRLFADLPLDYAGREVITADGQLLSTTIATDDAFMEMLRSWGNSFGLFLAVMIGRYNKTREADTEVIRLILGGGSGVAEAIIYFGVFTEEENATASVKFSLAPYGAGYLPDDAPPARIEHYSVVPGQIFPILRKMFTGDEDGPHKIILSSADLTPLSQELDS